MELLREINETAYGYPPGDFPPIAPMPGTETYLAEHRRRDRRVDPGVWAALGRTRRSSSSPPCPRRAARGISAAAASRTRCSNARERGNQRRHPESRPSSALPVYERLGYRDVGGLEMWERRSGTLTRALAGYVAARGARPVHRRADRRGDRRDLRARRPSARPSAQVARAAPRLQRILAEALGAGGWFGESHDAEVLKAATTPGRGGAADGRAHAAGRGGAHGNDGWGRCRLGIGRSARTAGIRTDEGGLTQMEINYIGHSTVELVDGRHPRTDRSVPGAEQPGRQGLRGRRGSDPRRHHARPPGSLRRRGRGRQADRRLVRGDLRARQRARRAGHRGLHRPQPRRDRRVRLGLGQARAGLPHQHRPGRRDGPSARSTGHRDRRRVRARSSTSAARPSTTSATPRCSAT